MFGPEYFTPVGAYGDGYIMCLDCFDQASDIMLVCDLCETESESSYIDGHPCEEDGCSGATWNTDITGGERVRPLMQADLNDWGGPCYCDCGKLMNEMDCDGPGEDGEGCQELPVDEDGEWGYLPYEPGREWSGTMCEACQTRVLEAEMVEEE
jgi:hypothetical protein